MSSTPSLHSTPLSNPEFDPGIYLQGLWRGKWFIAIVGGTIFSLAVFYSWIAIPLYRTDVVLQLESESSGSSSSDDLFSVLAGDPLPISSEIENLKSRALLEQVVQRMGLDILILPRYFPVVGQALARRYPVADQPAPARWGWEEYAWGGERLGIESFLVPPQGLDKSYILEVLTAQSYRLLDEEGQEILRGEVDEMAMGFLPGWEEDPDNPYLQLKICDLQARPRTQFSLTRKSPLRAVLALQAKLKIGEKGKQTGLIKIAMEGPKKNRIRAIVNTLADLYVAQSKERTSLELQQRIQFIGEQIPDLKEKLDQAEEKLAQFYLQGGNLDLTQENRTLVDKLANLDGQISQLSLRKLEIQQKYTAEHRERQVLEHKLAQLKSEESHLTAKLGQLPELQIKAVQAERNAKVLEQLYLLLRTKKQELEVAKSGITGHARILDRAYLPLEPVQPKKPMLMAMGLILGMFTGVGLVLLRQSLAGGLENREHAERALGIDVLGEIPAIAPKTRKKQKPGNAGTSNPASAFSEVSLTEPFRNLRAVLLGREPVPGHIVLTAPESARGVGSIALHLACSLAASGLRTVVVDADLREGDLHLALDLPLAPGLSEILAGQTTWQETLRPFEFVQRNHQPLHIACIPRGDAPSHAPELLYHARLETMFAELRQRYDCVVYITSHLRQTTDAGIVARHADTALMVLRARRTTAHAARQAIARLGGVGVAVHGLIIYQG